MSCATCFQEIDKRKEINCSKCEKPVHKECASSVGSNKLCDACLIIHDERPSSKYGEFEMPKAIRRSHIETYKSCPYKFYQEVIKGKAMPPNEYTQVGIDVHDILEAVVTENISLEKAIEWNNDNFKDYPDELFTSKTRDAMFRRAERSIHTLFETVPYQDWEIVTAEETIEFDIGENIPKVQITMDLVTRDEKGLHLHDWKTGRVMVGKNLSTDLQAPLYINAVQKRFGEQVKSFTFYYLNENKTRTYHQTEEDPQTYVCQVRNRKYYINLTDTIREVKSLFSKIKNGQFDADPNAPNRYFTQKMCHLKETGECCQDANPWNQI